MFNSKTKESEKDLEARLVREVEARGGMAIKLTSQFHRGLPDRLVVLPFHTLTFVEMKSSGEDLRPLQEACLAKLREMYFAVRVIDSTEKLDAYLAMIDSRLAEAPERLTNFREKKSAAIAEAKERAKLEYLKEYAEKRLRKK